MVKWTERTRGIWIATVGGLEISVHHYVGMGDRWLMSCHKFGGQNCKDLKTDDLDTAKSTALAVFEEYLKVEIEVCQNALAELKSNL